MVDLGKNKKSKPGYQPFLQKMPKNRPSNENKLPFWRLLLRVVLVAVWVVGIFIWWLVAR